MARPIPEIEEEEVISKTPYSRFYLESLPKQDCSCGGIIACEFMFNLNGVWSSKVTSYSYRSQRCFKNFDACATKISAYRGLSSSSFIKTRPGYFLRMVIKHG